MSLPNLEVSKTEHTLKAVVRLVNIYNCIAFDWTIKDESKFKWHHPIQDVVRISVSPKKFNKHLILIVLQENLITVKYMNCIKWLEKKFLNVFSIGFFVKKIIIKCRLCKDSLLSFRYNYSGFPLSWQVM